MYRLSVVIQTAPGPWLKCLFPDVTVKAQSATEAALSLTLEDMAAVYGFLLRVRDAGLQVVSLTAHAMGDH